MLIVASELGGNAIAHSASGQGGWFIAEVTMLGPVVRIAIIDQGGPGKPRVITDPDGETGRGLLLVTGLSERTGVTGDQHARIVWADIKWDHPGAIPAAAILSAAGTRQDAALLPAGQPHG